MTASTVQRKLAAILSADAVGYSRLMAGDEAATIKTLNAHRGLIGGLVRQHGGRIVDAVGDNLLAEFPSVVDAVACAVAIQGELAKRNADLPEDGQMSFRIGIHLGDVVVEGDQVYGDGVNIAARLESLAGAGGICISSSVHEQVRRKLSHAYEDIGEQTLKNIADPVRVYRVQCGADEDVDEATKLTVPGFAGRPAIAVLAFDNLSGDPEQEYFADGIAEDLITRLAAFRLFPVIARNSSFIYKGKSVDVKRVSDELGARYVVEGSVRKAGDQVRVTAQLIDATTGHHIWAERYDRKLTDIFALQDEIITTVIRSLEPALSRAEEHRAMRKPPETGDAWDCVHRGFWHANRFTKEDTRKALSWMRKACELDPSFSPAFSGLALACCNTLIYQTSESSAETMTEGLQAAERCIALSADDSMAYFTLGLFHTFMGQFQQAIVANERALDLNPSFAWAYQASGFTLACAGRPDEAIGMAEKAMRLAPVDAPGSHVVRYTIGIAHFVAGRYEEAVEWARQSLGQRSDYPPSLRLVAAALGHLSHFEEARAALDEMHRLVPDFSTDVLRLYLPPRIVDRYLEGWRKAGWKDEVQA